MYRSFLPGINALNIWCLNDPPPLHVMIRERRKIYCSRLQRDPNYHYLSLFVHQLTEAERGKGWCTVGWVSEGIVYSVFTKVCLITSLIKRRHVHCPSSIPFVKEDAVSNFIPISLCNIFSSPVVLSRVNYSYLQYIAIFLVKEGI
jgi:hypothetical protein